MFLLGATLALGFAISALIISNAAVKISKKETIRVKGSATKLIKSDFGTWTGSISVRTTDLTDGFKILENHIAQAEKLILDSGVTDKEFSMENVNIETNYKYDAKGNRLDEVNSYTLRRNVIVNSSQVETLENLAKNFTNLIKSGIMAESYNVNFIIQNLDNYKLELLAEATDNGLARAKILANNTNGQVGCLLNASQGIFQVLAPGASDISDYGTYDKSTIMKEIRAVVTLEFRVD